MSKSPAYFLQHNISNTIEAIVNIYLFLPYFFSVETLLKTLFSPWKGLTDTSTSRGFSLNEIFNRFMFNLISISMGFIIRSTVLGLFFVVQSIYIIFIPVILVIYLLTLPVQFFFFLILPTEDDKKRHQKAIFIKKHTLDQAHLQYVEQWFDYRYQQQQYDSQWWKLHNLFETVPLASDWAAGYTPHLDEFSTELSSGAYQRHRDHIVGRKSEVQAIEQALLKSEEANVLLVGDEGVGKHTIVDVFARNLFHGKCNRILAFKRVVKLHMDKIMSRSKDGKEREVLLAMLMKEAAKAKNVILMIDNFDKYVSSGSANRVDMSGPIVEFGRTGNLQIIGITTPYSYNKYIFMNEQVKMLFERVQVNEISKQEALQILFDATHQYEKRYKVIVPYEVLIAIIEKSDFFITDIPFPEKALHLLDNVCVYASQTMKQKMVLPQMIDVVLSAETHTPTTLNEDMKQRLLKLEDDLGKRVINQTEAIHELAAAMRRAFLLLGKRRKPLASFLFLGSTGVGKTETAKALSHIFFGDEKTLMRFDMSLYQSKEDIPKLVGSSESQNPGLLTNAIRQQPYGVLLLDEIEKADKNLLNIFLTILDEGYYTDGFGKRVDCKNLVIIATSNAGADYLFENQKNGTQISTNQLIAYLIENGYYAPEFLNRFDGVIAYHPIESTSMLPIARKMLSKIQQNVLELYDVHLEVSDEALQYVLQNNVDPSFGARNLDRVLRDHIEDQVAQLILSGKAQPGATIRM
ncbi:MAG: AAA family ATPase [Patescibacteria group bacterium]